MILDAEQARERAYGNTPTMQLVEKLMQEIENACDSGRFTTTFYTENETNYTVRHAADALRRLGYVVIQSEDESSLYIDWRSKR